MDSCTYKDPRCATTEQCWCTGTPIPPIVEFVPKRAPELEWFGPTAGTTMFHTGLDTETTLTWTDEITTDAAEVEQVQRELQGVYDRLMRNATIIPRDRR